MKKTLLLILMAISLNTMSQSIYGSISGGYNFLNQVSPQLLPVNSFHTVTLPWFTYQENLFLNQTFNLDVSFGHQLNENVGYETTGTYMKGIENVSKQDLVTTTISGSFYSINPKIVLTANLKKISLYTKLGFIIGSGKISAQQYFKNDASLNLGFNEATLSYDYFGGVSLGMNGCIGINKNITKKFSIFLEMTAVSQSYSPRKGTTTEYKIDNQDQLELFDLYVYSTDIDFGDTDENFVMTSTDVNNPQKRYKHNFNLNNFGLNIGVKFILWHKKKLENDES